MRVTSKYKKKHYFHAIFRVTGFFVLSVNVWCHPWFDHRVTSSDDVMLKPLRSAFVQSRFPRTNIGTTWTIYSIITTKAFILFCCSLTCCVIWYVEEFLSQRRNEWGNCSKIPTWYFACFVLMCTLMRLRSRKRVVNVGR